MTEKKRTIRKLLFAAAAVVADSAGSSINTRLPTMVVRQATAYGSAQHRADANGGKAQKP